MGTVEFQMILSICQTLLQYGPEFIKQLKTTLEKDNVTLEEIQALHALIPDKRNQQ